MKQIRKISNIVAEELEASLNAKGITMSEDAFESKVSKIVNMISEAVEKEDNEADVKEALSAFFKGYEIVEGVLDEDVVVADIYRATTDTTIGDTDVAEGEFIQIDEIDMDNDEVSFIVYDTEGDVRIESATADYDDVEKFTEEAEIIDLEEDGEIEEAFGKQHIMALKKKGFSAKDIKLKEKLAAKKVGNGVNKFTIKAGKIVKKTAAQLKDSKRKSKTFARKMKRFAKKRIKSMKKNFKKWGAKEGFDITSNGMKVAVEEGDILTLTDGALTITREGTEIVSGIEVSEGFIERCISEDVLEGKDCKKEKEKADEAAILTFRSDKGFIMVREGAEVPMGNRVRARAILRNEGYEVTAEMLDNASTGKLVIL